MAPRDQEKAALYTLLTRTMNASFTSFLEDSVATFMGTAAAGVEEHRHPADTLAIIEEYRQHLTPFADAQATAPYSRVPRPTTTTSWWHVCTRILRLPRRHRDLAADYYGNDPEPTDAPKLPSSGEELADRTSTRSPTSSRRASSASSTRPPAITAPTRAGRPSACCPGSAARSSRVGATRFPMGPMPPAMTWRRRAPSCTRTTLTSRPQRRSS